MNRHFFVSGLILLLLFSIVACGGGESPAPTTPPVATSPPGPASTQEPPPTAVPAPTPEPTATSDAAVSPTATLQPTVTATPPPPPTFTLEPIATSVREAEVTSPVGIGPSKDNTLYEDTGGLLSNGAGQHIFVGRNNNDLVRRSVIAFDIVGSIPEGAIINSVTLTLNMSRTQAEEETVQLHRLLADWGEGASDAASNEGGGTGAGSGDATWIHTQFDSETWQSPGGDFSATASADNTVGGAGRYTWDSTDAMVADVQVWLDDPSTNFGWLLLGNEGETRTTKRFDSKDNSLPANRPTLTIEFTAR